MTNDFINRQPRRQIQRQRRQNSANILFDPFLSRFSIFVFSRRIISVFFFLFSLSSSFIRIYWRSVLSGRWIAKINENKSYFDYG